MQLSGILVRSHCRCHQLDEFWQHGVENGLFIPLWTGHEDDVEEMGALVILEARDVRTFGVRLSHFT